MPNAENDAVSHGPDNPCEPKCHGWGIGCPCNPRSAENDATTKTEWAVQCYTSGGQLFTGRPFRTRKQAEESGERLTRINGAEWWLVSRRVTTFAAVLSRWTRVIPPEKGDTP